MEAWLRGGQEKYKGVFGGCRGSIEAEGELRSVGMACLVEKFFGVCCMHIV